MSLVGIWKVAFLGTIFFVLAACSNFTTHLDENPDALDTLPSVEEIEARHENLTGLEQQRAVYRDLSLHASLVAQMAGTHEAGLVGESDEVYHRYHDASLEIWNEWLEMDLDGFMQAKSGLFEDGEKSEFFSQHIPNYAAYAQRREAAREVEMDREEWGTVAIVGGLVTIAVIVFGWVGFRAARNSSRALKKFAENYERNAKDRSSGSSSADTQQRRLCGYCAGSGTKTTYGGYADPNRSLPSTQACMYCHGSGYE